MMIRLTRKSIKSWRAAGLVAVVLLAAGAMPLQARSPSSLARQCAGNDPKQAIEACNTLLSTARLPPSQRSNVLANRAVAFNRVGRRDRAMTDLDVAIRLQPRHVGALNLRGLLHNDNGDHDRALADLNAAIRIDPKAFGPYHNRGNAWNGKKQYDKAIRDFDEALRRGSRSALTYQGRGLAYGNRRDYDRAIRDFDQALRIDPKLDLALLARARAYRAKGDRDQALRDLDAAVRIDATRPATFELRGVVYRERKQYAQAFRDFDEAIRLDPKRALTYANRGITYREKGEYARAIQDYDEAIRLDPKMALFYFHRAIARRLNDDLTGAYRDIVTELALNPSHPEGQRERDRLRSLLSSSAQAAPAATANVAAATPAPVKTAAPAAVQPQGRRVALVIGNGKYAFAPELPNPPNDARDMAAALRDLGFTVIEGYDLDGETMRDKIAAFGAAMPGAATTLFFYAGHGVQVAGKNYLVPVDAKLARPSALGVEAIQVGTILADMETEKRINLVFLDACRNNPLARSLARSFSRTRAAAVGQGLAQIDAGIGTLITFATSPNNVALDGTGDHSPFTAALLKHIRTPDVEIRTLLTRVRADVIAATNERQIPWDHSSLTGEFYFKRGG